MSALRALIVDDERLARSELRRLLAVHPAIEIAGEAANAKEARRAIADLEPDLLFLDVQMPGETGFDLLASLGSVPMVVFSTAYDEYALRAFGPRLNEDHRVFVAEGERCWLVRLGDIRLFESAGNSTRIFFGAEKPLIPRALGELASKLEDPAFFRANRHQIVNLKAVRSIHQWFGGRLMVVVEGGHEVTLSRRRARALREWMSV